MKTAKDRRKIQISEVNRVSQKCARSSLKKSESNQQETIGPSLTSQGSTKTQTSPSNYLSEKIVKLWRKFPEFQAIS